MHRLKSDVSWHHTLRTFCREVSQEELGIKFAERTMCLAFMEAMAYVGSLADYDDLYVQFCASAPVAVRRYFDRNWHEIREEWVACFKLGHGNYMTNTNNRLESLNQKIKAVVKRYSTIPVFYRNLMICLASMRVERDHRALDLNTRVKQVQPDTHPALVAYLTLLTPFAYASLIGQMDKSEGLQHERAIDNKQQPALMAAPAPAAPIAVRLPTCVVTNKFIKKKLSMNFNNFNCDLKSNRQQCEMNYHVLHTSVHKCVFQG